MSWEISCRPEGKNQDGENKGGIVVYLVNGTAREEVGRVAFDRSESESPGRPFAEVLDEYLANAKKGAEAVNTMVASSQGRVV